MAFDGSVVYAITRELHTELTDGRIIRIAQTEKDELLLTIKKEGRQKRLLLSVNPSLPMVYLTDQSKQAPMQAPAFCMLLRKHLVNGRILSVTQPSMERIIEFEIEHFNEMGDLCRKTLTVELMGKYSNIILRQDRLIMDSIRRVSSLMSSVREVLPGREYFVPFGDDKLNPFTASGQQFRERVFSQGAQNAAKALYGTVTGFSPMLAQEILLRAGVDADRPVSSFTQEEQDRIHEAFENVVRLIREVKQPMILFRENEPVSYGTFPYLLYEDPAYTRQDYDSISALLYDFYSRKQAYTSIRQKTADLRQTVHNLLNKSYKKYDLQLRQLRDTEKKDKYRVYGEILTAYGYSMESGASSVQAVDFYTGEPVTIPLDPTISPVENGKKYFMKYAKLKRTADALQEIIVSTKEETDHLESIMVSLDMVRDHADIAELKRELAQAGFLKHSGQDSSGRGKASGRESKSSPLHYVSRDGFHMYVGKNNFQNEYLTFKLASGSDWWFHAKDIPGSHVIVKTEGAELPDTTYEEAARLAAHYSKTEGSAKVEVQYTQKKNLRKPPASRPGMVVFHTYYSMAAETDISGIAEVK